MTTSTRYANYVLGVLVVVYTFNFIDRQILAILLDPIKADLGASDTQMGFLSGLAFALFYTVAGIPIARWADRGVRRTIIAIGLRAISEVPLAIHGYNPEFIGHLLLLVLLPACSTRLASHRHHQPDTAFFRASPQT